MATKARVLWSGLDEYVAELRRLPTDSHTEAARIVEGGVNGAFVQIAAVYGAHQVTGDLRRKLTIAPLKVRRQLTTGLLLRNTSKIAWVFDHGSQARHYTTVNGATHLTGAMPARPTFNRIVGQTKRRIGRQLRDMLRRRGATAITERPDA